MTEALAASRRLIEFIDASPTPFHAVTSSVALLEAAGFSRLDEGQAWELAPGQARYVVRNQSTLLAFRVGQEDPAVAGFRLIGAHTDSPNLRLKPKASYVKEGYRQFGIEPYGGVLLATWLDRDLSLAGRILVRGEDEARLLRIERPLARVANVAIHLNREVNSKGLKLDKQKHLPPLVGLGAKGDEGWLEELVVEELGLSDAASIEGFDLMLYDVVPSVISGIDREFVHAPRLDNLGSCHAGLEALIGAAAETSFTQVVALYDHEEVGSRSAEGEDGPMLEAILERIVLARGGSREDLHRAKAKSTFVSADMAHAVHPNYGDLHEPRHMPRLNGGPVLKLNSNLRYATNSASARQFIAACCAEEVPLQRFVNRSDLACGSTIGPITAARVGIPTVDVGNPMLSMHSIREMCGSADQILMIRAMRRFLCDS
ncbi:MAG: M18 family aminopeptidase [Planctomycetes bacterium]|nr:M18 family aminopeptidase [Planctomycetota bacterium]